MTTICRTYCDEDKMIEIPNVGKVRLISEVIEDGKVVMQSYNTIVNSREEALSLRKALKETGWDKRASFSKKKIFVGINENTCKFEYKEKYVVSALHHFN